jgi:hypothetical protein
MQLLHDGTTTADLITRSGTGASIIKCLSEPRQMSLRTATIYAKVATGLGTDGIILRIFDNSSLSNFVQMQYLIDVTNIGETSDRGQRYIRNVVSIEDAWQRVD